MENLNVRELRQSTPRVEKNSRWRNKTQFVKISKSKGKSSESSKPSQENYIFMIFFNIHFSLENFSNAMSAGFHSMSCINLQLQRRKVEDLKRSWL